MVFTEINWFLHSGLIISKVARSDYNRHNLISVDRTEKYIIDKMD